MLRYGSRSEESLWLRKTDADAANCDDRSAAGNAIADYDSEDSSPEAFANADRVSASNGDASEAASLWQIGRQTNNAYAIART